jgi:hypothetical protein
MLLAMASDVFETRLTVSAAVLTGLLRESNISDTWSVLSVKFPSEVTYTVFF